MQVTLCNKGHPEYGFATIPFPIPDEEYSHCMALLEQIEIGDVTAHDCYVDQIHDAPPALDMLEGTMINVDELDFLARSIDRYTDEELAKFQCMTSTREHWDMQTLINLSFSCEQVSVITDFAKLEEAGRSHYMTVHGGGVPVEEYHQLNGIGIARGLIADGGGRITPYGVVFENAMRIDPVYDGHSFPPYMDQPYLMEFTLETPLEGETTFFLPQPEKRLERLLERARIDASIKLDIRTWHSDLPDPVMERLDFPNESIYEMKMINDADSVFQVYMLVNKPYGLTFLKFSEPYLSQEDLSRILSSAWVMSENPNADANLTKRRLVSLFRSADPSVLMDEDERQMLTNLDATVTVYRGVTSYNAKNVRALSWTLSYDTAKWFASRFGEYGTVYEAQVHKEHILALFNGRNEAEVIIDPKNLMNIEQRETLEMDMKMV